MLSTIVISISLGYDEYTHLAVAMFNHCNISENNRLQAMIIMQGTSVIK